jgi:uncharacterized protein
MKRKIYLTVGILFLLCCAGIINNFAGTPTVNVDYPIQPVPFTSVKITDKFWAPRIHTNYEVTIPIALDQCYKTGRVDNFEIAGKLKPGKFSSQYPFDDTDIYKLIEAASYSLQTIPDKTLDARLDTLIYYIGKAQEPDGYLYTNRTIDPEHTHEWAGKERWVNDPNNLSHELYNCGHLYEAAVAHNLATGKRELLDVAIKNADLLCNVFGPEPGKLKLYPGHQIVEMGLVRLYRLTENKKYLDLAKFFLDVRGPGGDEYNQAHKKVIDQTEAVGHAVRATYMYSGMADIAALDNDQSYIHAIRAIWEDIVYKKLYITGGIGSGGGNEGFDPAYVLPNMSAYCETCASVGNIFWNQRMFLYDGNAEYIDVLERTLYNSLLSGVSLSGDRFFYPNVLQSIGQHQRSEWFGCACCPPNLARLLPSIPGYIYAKTKDAIYVNLFVDNTAKFDFNGSEVELIQKTNYPWDGSIALTVNPTISSEFNVLIRIPGWAETEVVPGSLYKFADSTRQVVQLSINGKKINIQKVKGYAVIRRKWKKGDVISLELPMNVRKVVADEKVKADKDRMAIERGPIMYCAEWPYNKDGKVLSLIYNKDAQFSHVFDPDLLNGIEKITTKAKQAKRNIDNSIKCSEEQDVTLIPYYSWNNKGAGEMEVWLPVSEHSVQPMLAPTIASKSKVTASIASKAVMALNDQYEPINSIDRSWPYFHWWPKSDSWEWVQYDFEKNETVSCCKVYWFDDGPFGGCRVPDTWEIQYKKGNEWVSVKTVTCYKVTKDAWDEINFEPVTTGALRLRVKLSKEFSSGIHEWIVK